MTFLTLVAALLLDLYVLVPVRGKFDGILQHYAELVRHTLDAGEHHFGIIAWLAVIAPIGGIALVAYVLLNKIGRAHV